MAVRAYEAQRASWIEQGSPAVVVEAIAARVKSGRVVERDDTTLTVQYGSPTMFRLMGGLFTPRWFPIWATLTVTANEKAGEVEVIGTDRKGRYLYGISLRRGERSLGERSFIAQFQRVCAELSRSTVSYL